MKTRKFLVTVVFILLTLAFARQPASEAALQGFTLAPDSLKGRAPTVLRTLPQVAVDETPTDQIILKYKATANLAGGASRLAALSALAGVPLVYVREMSGGAHVLRLPSPLALIEVQAITAKLVALSDVEYAQPDYIMHPMLEPNDPLYTNQWHYSGPQGINAPAAWDIITGSNDIVIAVIDTGYLNHADLAGRFLPGYDFIFEPLRANDGDGRDADATDSGDWITAEENDTGIFQGCGVSNSSWHGTHVAGTIGAVSNNGVGVAGINWVSKILPVRVLGKCGGYMSDIVDGMRWAAGLPISGVSLNTHPAQVLNMSLGGKRSSPPYCDVVSQAAINDITAMGTTVIVAAGNANDDAQFYTPASCNGVVTVAATDRNGSRAYYSNYGTVVEIAAPGGDKRSSSSNGILSTLNSGQTVPVGDVYAWYQGTSMATPHVVGVASLLLSLSPSLTPNQVSLILRNTARAFPGGSTCDTSHCGSGIVDAGAAVSELPRITSLSPASASAGSSSVVLTVNGANFDSGSVVKVNGSARTTTYISNTQVTVNLNAADLAQVGTLYIAVTTNSATYGAITTLSKPFAVSFSGKTWNGSTSNDWHTANNWMPSGVPTSTDDVTIPNVTLDPVISNGNAAVKSLVLNSGAVLDLTSRKLTVEGTLTNNGTLKQTTSVAGSSPTDFLRITNLADTRTKYYGVDITPSSAASANVTVSVSGNQLCAGRVTGVKRCFDIAPSAALTATVRFYLSEAERNGQTLSDLLVLHYSGSWAAETGPYTRGGAGSAQYVQAQNVNDFSPFALAVAVGGVSSSLYLPIVMNRWPPIPDTPTLNAISNPIGSVNYTVSWNAAYLADTYTLQEAKNAAFSGPVTVYGPGSGLSWSANGKAAGTYYYRVKASNSYGDSGWSNVQSVFVQPPSLFYAIADATALQGIPDTNDGTDPTMWTGYEHEACSGFSGIARSLAKFDLSPVPVGMPIAQATLSLYLAGSCDTGNNSRLVTTYRITGDWSETSVTWNTQPGFAEAYSSSSVSSRTFQRYSVDVTNLVRAWVNHTYANYGLMLRSPESSDSARLAFGTRQAGFAYAPYITITYVNAATSMNGASTVEGIPDPGCKPAIKGMPNASSDPLKSGMFEVVEELLCSRR